jgi:hypothetical protein
VNDATTDSGAVWKRKKDENRYMYGRDGDMWSVPFQCEWCWLVNLKGRDFNRHNPKDLLLCGYLRRMNLDMMWSREPSTVSANLGLLRKGARMSEELGLEPRNIPRGPWPVGDPYGCQTALEILRASQLPGKHSADYQQFDTIRKIRSGFSTAFESSPMGWNLGNVAFKTEHGKVYTLHSMPTESLLFSRFMTGLLSRMGKVVIPEMAVSNAMVHGLLRYCEESVGATTTTWESKRKAIMTGAFICLCYGCSLRGNEGLYLEASDFCSYIHWGKEGLLENNGIVEDTGHVCAPLLGRFKNEYGEQKHLMTCINKSKSGIRFRLWLERLAHVLNMEGKQHIAGPAFCNTDGTMLESKDMNASFVVLMERLKFEREELFEGVIDVDRDYGISRSLRRGANTRAKEEGVDKELRDFVNRWSTFEARRGARPNESMAQHYVEAKLIMKRTLVYSRSL